MEFVHLKNLNLGRRPGSGRLFDCGRLSLLLSNLGFFRSHEYPVGDFPRPCQRTLLGIGTLAEELKLPHLAGILYLALRLTIIDGRLPRRLLAHLTMHRTGRM